MSRIKELYAQAGAAIEEARSILNSENVDAEAEARADKLMDEATALKAKAEKIQDAEQRQARLDEAAERYAREARNQRPGNTTEDEERSARDSNAPTYKTAFGNYIRRGLEGVMDSDRRLLNENRALQVGTDSEGGYTVPTEFHALLVPLLTEQNVMRRIARVYPTTSSTGELPIVSSHGTAVWKSEEAAFTDTDAAFGQVTMGAYKLTARIPVSEELLADSAFNMEAFIREEMALQLARGEEAAFVNGDGSSKPTGATDGASAGVTAASATAITSDEVIELYHSLAPRYRTNATWLFNDTTAKLIRKLKDGNQQYIWQPGLQAGQPDTLLGRPVAIADNAEAPTTGLVPMLFGDFQLGYGIFERAMPVIRRHDDTLANTGQVLFRAYTRLDGKVIRSEAIKKLTMA